MPSPLEEIFSSELFMPHGHCYLWKPGLVWLQVSSNAFIGLAYVAISATLAYLVSRVRDIPFKVMYLAFGIFIVTCGLTHFFDVATVWVPFYWIDGGLRAVTAVASVGTALALPSLVPKAVALARGAKAAHDRGIVLETAVKDLGTMYERTRELEQLKTQFFANVSHELRTPLALVLGPVEKLLADERDQEKRRQLEVVRRNAQTLLKQVNDLLDVSKLEAGRLVADRADTDLAALLRSTAAQFESYALDRQVAFSVQLPTGLAAQVDPDQVQRIVLNLLSNAFKFTPVGGRIRLSLRSEGGAAALEVADSGPGIGEEHRAAVFERFRQLEGGSTRRFGGTGLGLAIVRDFAQLHGGSVSVARAPEGGALFSVLLPLRAPPGAQVRPRSGLSAGAAEQSRAALSELRSRVEAFRAGPALDKPVVLVVEDNPEMNRFVCETLAAYYQVEAAFDGAQGLARAVELKPDLVLTDVMMPVMSGEQLVTALRERAELASLPIILLTAKADDELRVSLLGKGAQDYMMKPFHAEELLARVANLVAMKRARELLQRDLATQQSDIEELVGQVTRSRHELQGALEMVRVARDQAEQASRAKSDFLGLVSHELRTPLTSLRLQLDRLERDAAALPEKPRGLLPRMVSSVQRLTELVESLLQFTRVQSGRLAARRSACEVGALAKEVAEELRFEAERRGLSLSAAGTAFAGTDPHLLRLMISNLAGNALKFTRQGGVRIDVAAQGTSVRIAVQDTGPGIAPENHERIFEPFEQLEPVAGKHTPGIGLGLALVKEMAHALGATIEVQSEPGRGSTFTIVLPGEQA